MVLKGCSASSSLLLIQNLWSISRSELALESRPRLDKCHTLIKVHSTWLSSSHGTYLAAIHIIHFNQKVESLVVRYYVGADFEQVSTCCSHLSCQPRASTALAQRLMHPIPTTLLSQEVPSLAKVHPAGPFTLEMGRTPRAALRCC